MAERRTLPGCCGPSGCVAVPVYGRLRPGKSRRFFRGGSPAVRGRWPCSEGIRCGWGRSGRGLRVVRSSGTAGGWTPIGTTTSYTEGRRCRVGCGCGGPCGCGTGPGPCRLGRRRRSLRSGPADVMASPAGGSGPTRTGWRTRCRRWVRGSCRPTGCGVRTTATTGWGCGERSSSRRDTPAASGWRGSRPKRAAEWSLTGSYWTTTSRSRPTARWRCVCLGTSC